MTRQGWRLFPYAPRPLSMLFGYTLRATPTPMGHRRARDAAGLDVGWFSGCPSSGTPGNRSPLVSMTTFAPIAGRRAGSRRGVWPAFGFWRIRRSRGARSGLQRLGMARLSYNRVSGQNGCGRRRGVVEGHRPARCGAACAFGLALRGETRTLLAADGRERRAWDGRWARRSGDPQAALPLSMMAASGHRPWVPKRAAPASVTTARSSTGGQREQRQPLDARCSRSRHRVHHGCGEHPGLRPGRGPGECRPSAMAAQRESARASRPEAGATSESLASWGLASTRCN